MNNNNKLFLQRRGRYKWRCGWFLTQRKLNNYIVTARMIGVIIFVTDRLRRTESIMIMILMMDLRECVCVRKSSVGDVSPHTGSLSPMPSVLPVRTHTRRQKITHTHTYNAHTKSLCWENRHANILLQEDVCVQRWTLIKIRILCNLTQITNTQTHTHEKNTLTHRDGR